MAEMADPSLMTAVNAPPWRNRCAVMGILNVTPDSFSGDGVLGSFGSGDSVDGMVAAALRQAEAFVAAGADILDIGGESTRPGAEQVPASVEAARVQPVIAAVRKTFPAIPISIDTWKAEVARIAIAAGATIINDVWAGAADPDMRAVMAKSGLPCILMHNRSSWGAAQVEGRAGASYIAPQYQDFMPEILDELRGLADEAMVAGVRPENIILDPGVGFGKTVAQNLQLIRDLGQIRALGYPVLLGTSRKSFIGKVLDVGPDERLMGTAATIALGVAAGADFVRVHDVAEMVQIVRMSEAVLGREGAADAGERGA